MALFFPIPEFLEVSSSPFSFLRFVDTSPSEIEELTASLLKRWCHLAAEIKRLRERARHEKHFAQAEASSRFLGKRDLLIVRPRISAVEAPGLVFSPDAVFCHVDVVVRSTPETIEHRIIRTKHRSNHHRHHVDHHKSIYNNLVPEFVHVQRPEVVRRCQPSFLPKFLFSTCLRVATPGRLPYSYDRSAAWKLQDHLLCTNKEGMLSVKFGDPDLATECAKTQPSSLTSLTTPGGIFGTKPPLGWSNIIVPGKTTYCKTMKVCKIRIRGLFGRIYQTSFLIGSETPSWVTLTR